MRHTKILLCRVTTGMSGPCIIQKTITLSISENLFFRLPNQEMLNICIKLPHDGNRKKPSCFQSFSAFLASFCFWRRSLKKVVSRAEHSSWRIPVWVSAW